MYIASVGQLNHRVIPQDLSFEDQCKAALHSLDGEKINAIVSIAEGLEGSGELNIASMIPLFRKAFDTQNQTVLNLFFASFVKDHFFIHRGDLMVGGNKEQSGDAYILFNVDPNLIPDSVIKVDRHSCWKVTTVWPNDYQVS